MFSLIIIGIIGFFVLLGLMILFFLLDKSRSGVFEYLGALCMIIVLLWIIAFSIIIGAYRSSEEKTKIINKKYGTEYTVEQIFWAGDLIDQLKTEGEKNHEGN